MIIAAYIDERIIEKLDSRLTKALLDISNVDEKELEYLDKELKALKYFKPELTESCDKVHNELHKLYDEYQRNLEDLASEHDTAVYGFNVLLEDGLHHYLN